MQTTDLQPNLSCSHDALEKSSCEQCDYLYCCDCRNTNCNWCDINRNEQIPCPQCSITIDFLDKNVCIGDIISAIDNNWIIYCLDCEIYIHTAYTTHDSSHQIIKSHYRLYRQIIDAFPETEIFIELYGPDENRESSTDREDRTLDKITIGVHDVDEKINTDVNQIMDL